MQLEGKKRHVPLISGVKLEQTEIVGPVAKKFSGALHPKIFRPPSFSQLVPPLATVSSRTSRPGQLSLAVVRG